MECSNEEIDLYGILDGEHIKRKELGILAVVLDILIMVMFLFFLWSMSYMVKVDSERHRNLLFET